MEAATLSNAAVRPASVEVVRARASEAHRRDWPLAVVIFGAAFAIYAAVGVGLYLLVAALI